jgi:hypothetical protein
MHASYEPGLGHQGVAREPGLQAIQMEPGNVIVRDARALPLAHQTIRTNWL